MKKILSLGIMTFSLMLLSANAEVVGVVDFDRVVDNYSKVKIKKLTYIIINTYTYFLQV